MFGSMVMAVGMMAVGMFRRIVIGVGVGVVVRAVSGPGLGRRGGGV